MCCILPTFIWKLAMLKSEQCCMKKSVTLLSFQVFLNLFDVYLWYWYLNSELFAPAVLKLQYFQSLPAEQLGLQVWVTAYSPAIFLPCSPIEKTLKSKMQLVPHILELQIHQLNQSWIKTNWKKLSGLNPYRH
jgi:hypothetical protein